MLKIYLYALAVWVLIITLGVVYRRKKIGKILLRAGYVILILFCIEFACVLAFYVKNGRWTYDERKVYLRTLFEPNPRMIGVPRPNVQVTFRGKTYTHNSQGFRGKEFSPKSNKIRVIAMGGSTTYGANVSDNETWPFYLENALGPNYEVLNFGVIGHSTVEHINQASLILPEYKPDVLIIHLGLNDLRNMHIKNLAPDYSDYHAPSLRGGMGFCSEGGAQNLASVRVLIGVLKRVTLYPKCDFDDLYPQEDDSPAAEERAKYLYRRNLITLIAIAKRQGLKPILVPQVLIRETQGGGKMKWWIPFVIDETLPTFVNQYNEITGEVAELEGLYYAREVLEQPWTRDDFVDPSHLNAAGNQKFAALLQKPVITAGQSAAASH
jgi:lysophospholipase L1-like esterase